MRPCASSKGYDELQTLISVQKSAGAMPHLVVMHLSSEILHSKEVCPLPSLRTLAVRNAWCTGCCLGRLIVVLLHTESLQLARLEKSQSLHCTMNS